MLSCARRHRASSAARAEKTSKARIKRLRGVSRPQYRLRVGNDVRVFYDLTEDTVEVLAIVPKSDANAWLERYGEGDDEKGAVKAMKKVPLTKLKDDLSKYLRLAEKEAMVITRHGQPAGVLTGFASEDDWLDFQLENDPRFLDRIERARASLRNGQGVRLEDVAKGKARRTKRST